MRLGSVPVDHRPRSVVLLGSTVLLTLLLAGGVVLTRDADDGPMRTVKFRGRAPNGTIVALGDVLLGARNGSKPFEPAALVRSRDGGKTWAEESPPGMPKAAYQYLSLSRHDDVVVLAVPTEAEERPPGTPHTYDAFVWTTTDGERWHGPLSLAGTAALGPPVVSGVGSLLVTGATFGTEFALFASRDRGVTWRRTAVPGLDLQEGEVAQLGGSWSELDGSVRADIGFYGAENPARPQEASVTLASADGAAWRVQGSCADQCGTIMRSKTLLARRLEVSRDGGATWVRAAFDGPFERAVAFSSVADLPGGGFLATVLGYYYGGGGPLAWVVRSEDGVRWAPLLGPGADECPPDPSDTDSPGNDVSPLLRVRGKWYVSFSCFTRGHGLYAAGADGRAFRPVLKATHVGAPFRWQDGIAVPVVHGKDDRRLVVVRD